MTPFLIFLAFACASVWFTSHRTRWSGLTARYPFVPEGAQASEARFFLAPCRLDSLLIRLTVEKHEAGLFLQPGFPVRLAMPAVLIPWQKIKLAYVSEGSLLGRAHVELDFEDYPKRVSIYGSAGRETADWVKQAQGLTGPGPNYFFPGREHAPD